MERHRITDFAFDPVDRLLWVRMERPPSPMWIRRLELGVRDGISGAAVAVEPDRLSLPVASSDEYEALAALFGLVALANVLPSTTSEAGR